jgi:Zn-finger nucleic acid-binding protein
MSGEADILQPSTPTLDEPPPRVLNDKKGGVCPFGHGLLAWARVELDDGVEVFYLERCSTCSGVFFDDGEWDRLAHSRMLAHLDDLWDPMFQQRLAEARSRERWRAVMTGRQAASMYSRFGMM